MADLTPACPDHDDPIECTCQARAALDGWLAERYEAGHAAGLRNAEQAIRQHPGPNPWPTALPRGEGDGFWWDTRDRDAAAGIVAALAAAGQAPAPQPETAPDAEPGTPDLREQYAAALTALLPPGRDSEYARTLADAVLDVRDDALTTAQRAAEKATARGDIWKRKAADMEADRDRLSAEVDRVTRLMGEYADRGIANGQRAKTAEQRITAVLQLHREVDGSPHDTGSCIQDGQDWPCATRRALTQDGDV